MSGERRGQIPNINFDLTSMSLQTRFAGVR